MPADSSITDEDFNASRYAQGLQQLARPDRHGGRARPDPVSFAIWGIGDIFRGFGRSTVAKIGSTEITVDQFRQIYNDRLQQLSRQLGRPITPDQARALGLDQQLAGQLVAEAALDQRARQLRPQHLGRRGRAPDHDRPELQGAVAASSTAPASSDDPRNAGYTEPRFAAEQQAADAAARDRRHGQRRARRRRRRSSEALQPLRERAARDRLRHARPRARPATSPAPDARARSRTISRTSKAQFRAPEYRSIVVHVGDARRPRASPADVSDADARRYLRAQPGPLRHAGAAPARSRSCFRTPEEAQAAAARLEVRDSTFEALAKERGLTEKDIDLGLLTKAAIIDRAIADAAFALQEGAVSAPIKGTFGTVLITRRSRSSPSRCKPFEEVAAEIKQTIATDRARSELSTRHDKIEDERARRRAPHRDRAEARPRRRAPSRRSTARAATRTASRSPTCPRGVDVITAAFSLRCRRRQRAAADRRAAAMSGSR